VALRGIPPGQDEAGGDRPGRRLAEAIDRLVEIIGEADVHHRPAIGRDGDRVHLDLQAGADVGDDFLGEVGLDLIGLEHGCCRRRWRGDGSPAACAARRCRHGDSKCARNSEHQERA